MRHTWDKRVNSFCPCWPTPALRFWKWWTAPKNCLGLISPSSFLRHCVYSRYASAKITATTWIFVGQDCPGHSIVSFGQLVGRQFCWSRRDWSSVSGDLQVFVGLANGKCQVSAFKTMEKKGLCSHCLWLLFLTRMGFCSRLFCDVAFY